ncbi:AbrB/MazE/SpoVT family DNA-binding domain-containing protein [Methylobacterium sp. ID0610]|uniref:AbrB/MazE/SpoVT family DNA-binding domain-containing protein n=1 Tax=Methylobacterium carpenticola TaxID=3344827 RepID=UPI003673E646
MLALKVTAIGNSVGVVLPKEAVARLKLEKGDTVFLTESPDGYGLTPYDPTFEDQMRTAQDSLKRRRNALRALATECRPGSGGRSLSPFMRRKWPSMAAPSASAMRRCSTRLRQVVRPARGASSRHRPRTRRPDTARCRTT